MAKLADTPPMVGSVSTEINGRRLADSWVRAALVLAICMREKRPSCIRAPPLAEMQMKGFLPLMAASTPRTKRSPTTEPMEPPMKRNSNAATTTGRPSMRPSMTRSASSSWVFLLASTRRSVYFLLSLNLRESTGLTLLPISCRPSSSSNISKRCRAPMR